MHIVSGTLTTSALLIAIVVASGGTASAATCGDANRTGDVSVTDGVLVLRSAAQLPSVCSQDRCDMNVDGEISVTDGVLALRLAAGLQTTVACSGSQAGSLFGQIQKTVRIGIPAAPAWVAQTTTPCSGGGRTEDDGAIRTFFDCRGGDFTTNGTLTFSETGPDSVNILYDTRDLVESTGELVTTAGGLDYTFNARTDTTRVEGVLTHTSSILGVYTDEFFEVDLDGAFVVISGDVTTTITDGSDIFANLRVFVTTIFSPTLAQIGVTYADGTFDLFTLADGICEPCSGGCSNASLICLSCTDGCSAEIDRCGIDFDSIACDDGSYGPSGLCTPCSSNADCNGSEGLTCFDCGENCTGSTKRCGSSIAFVECVDGVF